MLDMGTEWKAASDAKDVFEGCDRTTGELKWTGTRVVLSLGVNSQLRALAELSGSWDAQAKPGQGLGVAGNRMMSLARSGLGWGLGVGQLPWSRRFRAQDPESAAQA